MRQWCEPRDFENNHFTEMCCGTEAGSYLRLIDSCITHLKAQRPSRTCNERKEEEKKKSVNGAKQEPLLSPRPSDAPRFLSDTLSAFRLLKKKKDPLLQLSHSLLRSAERESSLLTTYWSESTVSS